MNSNHLTDEQMGELLSDPKEQGKAGHLKVCSICSEEFESLLAATCDLRMAVKASAEQHRRAARRPEPLFHMPRTAWAGLVTAAILCVAAPLAVHHKPMRTAHLVAPVQQMQGGVSDAQLLSEVQNDVNSQLAQPMLPLAASAASSDAATSTTNSNY